MRLRHRSIVAAAALSGLVACTGSDVDTTSPESVLATLTTTTTTVTTTTTRPSDSTTRSPSTASELCSYENTVVLGQLASPALDETSGLVASRRHPDVIWAHNDGGDSPGLFAVGRDGADLGFHPIEAAGEFDGAVDIEDIAIVSGSNRDVVLLADIGDNGSERTSIRIHRVAEPEPGVVTPITDVEVIEYVYPDRPHNAEVLLVDEANRRIVIVTKEQEVVEGLPPDLGPTAPSFVFEGPLDGQSDVPIELTLAGTLDAPLLETRASVEPPQAVSLLGIGGLPTGGDVSSDGAVIAIRTYEAVWVWPRPTRSTVAESLNAEPCQAGSVREAQGEAVAFLDGSLITASEGTNPDLLQLRP